MNENNVKLLKEEIKEFWGKIISKAYGRKRQL